MSQNSPSKCHRLSDSGICLRDMETDGEHRTMTERFPPMLPTANSEQNQTQYYRHCINNKKYTAAPRVDPLCIWLPNNCSVSPGICSISHKPKLQKQLWRGRRMANQKTEWLDDKPDDWMSEKPLVSHVHQVRWRLLIAPCTAWHRRNRV